MTKSPFSILAAPAQRALDNAGIKNFDDLKKHTEAEVKEFHGMGPNALKKLKEAGATFKAN